MFPGLISGHFLNLLLLLCGITLDFFVLQVQFTNGNFSENGLKRWRNQEFGEKAEVDREQHSCDRDQAEVREL